MSYNTENYREQGTGAFHMKNVAFEAPLLENQPASTADTIAKLKTDFNALLDALKSAGIMEADEA